MFVYWYFFVPLHHLTKTFKDMKKQIFLLLSLLLVVLASCKNEPKQEIYGVQMIPQQVLVKI